MSTAPNLLNDDGTASMATLLMMSHHGFRRDLARFGVALMSLDRDARKPAQALRDEWKHFRGALHGHHEAEDTGIFPSLSTEHPDARATIERLTADHRHIDPLLDRGDRAFEAGDVGEAIEVIGELSTLLQPHLATEEAEIVPFLRAAKTFPPPPNDEMAAMFAEGFAWAMHGIAPEVLERVHTMLPPELLSRLPAARAAFDARCERAWGKVKPAAARTPIPEPT